MTPCMSLLNEQFPLSYSPCPQNTKGIPKEYKRFDIFRFTKEKKKQKKSSFPIFSMCTISTFSRRAGCLFFLCGCTLDSLLQPCIIVILFKRKFLSNHLCCSPINIFIFFCFLFFAFVFALNEYVQRITC